MPRILWNPDRKTLANTLRAMRIMADLYSLDPLTRRLVGQIFQAEDVDPRDHPGQIAAIHEYVQKFRYLRDPHGVELLNAPRWTLASGVGDCDCLVTLELSLLGAGGFRTAYGLSSVPGTWPPDHTYALVETPRGLLPLDPTHPGPPGSVSPAGARWKETRRGF